MQRVPHFSTDTLRDFQPASADTSFHSDLVEFLGDADVIMIHLGNRSPEDYQENRHPHNHYPEHHLGEDGVIDLISGLNFLKPRLFLVGEFGADEFLGPRHDDRLEYTSYIERMSGARSHGKRVLPADIGLRIRLPEIEVWKEHKPTKGHPTSDNPDGCWAYPADIRPLLLDGHEIHYT